MEYIARNVELKENFLAFLDQQIYTVQEQFSFFNQVYK